ncbi:MAG: hypothetical protein WBQ68_20990, partial [Terriglobales bacterium]
CFASLAVKVFGRCGEIKIFNRKDRKGIAKDAKGPRTRSRLNCISEERVLRSEALPLLLEVLIHV